MNKVSTLERSETLSENTVEAATSSRRDFLKGVGLSLFGLSACGDENPILPDHDINQVVNEAKDTGFGSWPMEGVDSEYIRELLNELQANKSNKERRVAAVRRSLRLLKRSSIDQYEEGTAFELDASGIYLTVKHAFIHQGNALDHTSLLTTVKDLSTGEINIAKGVIIQPDADMAIVIAPTGKPKQPTKDLGFDFSKATDHEKLWMIGYYPGKDEHMYFAVRPGKVDRSVHVPPYDIHTEEAARLPVRGLVPAGGTSGSPIVNEYGAVAGILTNAFPYGAKSLEEYEGAIITPVSYAATLPGESILVI